MPTGAFSVLATVTDQAGNVSSAAWSFRILESISIDSATLAVDATPTPTIVSYSATQDLYTFSDVVLGLGDHTVHMQPGSHAGMGRTYFDLPYATFTVSYSLLGAPMSVAVREIGTHAYSLAFEVSQAQATAGAALLQSKTVPITSLSAIVPKGATNAVVQASGNAQPKFRTCADPTVTPRCWPDPVLRLSSTVPVADNARIDVYGYTCGNKLIKTVSSVSMQVSYSVGSDCGPTGISTQASGSASNPRFCPTQDRTSMASNPAKDYRDVCLQKGEHGSQNFDQGEEPIRIKSRLFDSINITLAESKTEGFFYYGDATNGGYPDGAWWFDDRCCFAYTASEQWRDATHWHTDSLTIDIYGLNATASDDPARASWTSCTATDPCDSINVDAVQYFRIDAGVFWCETPGTDWAYPDIWHAVNIGAQGAGFEASILENGCPGLFKSDDFTAPGLPQP